MGQSDPLAPPQRSAADAGYSVVKLGLAAVPGASVAAELFGWIAPPLERRREEWALAVVTELRELQQGEPERFAKAIESDLFASVCLHAAQASVRAAEQEKRAALSAVVVNSARGADIGADLQLTFVRYIDELTPTHVSLLRAFASCEEEIRRADGYPTLLAIFKRETGNACTEEEFCLFCNDLGARLLLRLSTYLEEFKDLAEQPTIGVESDGSRPLARVTDLGRKFLSFIHHAPAQST